MYYLVEVLVGEDYELHVTENQEIANRVTSIIIDTSSDSNELFKQKDELNKK